MLRGNRRLDGILIIIFLLAFLLRVHGLGVQSLWYDEGLSVSLVGQSLAHILLGGLDHPPLYHLLLAIWIRLAGYSEFAVRFLSVFWGLLVVALGGALGARLLGRRAGALAALLLAVSPIEVWYAQEARMYAALAALSLASTVCVVRLVHGDRRGWLWVLYGASSAAALYTHYYAALILVAQAVWVFLWLLQRRDWRFARSWLLAQVLVAVAFLPWSGVLWRQWRAANTTYWPGLLRWHEMAARTALGFAGESLMVSHGVALKLALLAGGLAVLGLVAGFLRAHLRWRVLLLATYVIVPFVLLYLLLHTRPKYSPRYLLPIVPGLLLLAAIGVAVIGPRGVRRWWDVGRAGLALAIGGSLALGSAYAATNPLRDPGFGRDDIRGAAALLSRSVGASEAIVLLSGHMEPVFAYYYRTPNDHCYPLPPGLPASPSVDDVVTLDVLDDLNEVIRGRRGVWLLLWQDEVVDPNGVVLATFDLLTSRVAVEESFRGLDLRHYVFPPGTRLSREAFAQIPLNVSVGQEGLILVSCDLPTAPVPAGAMATVLLHCRTLQPLSCDYRQSFRLIDEQGQECTRQDGPLSSEAHSPSRWRPGLLVTSRHDLHLPPTLPPGDYTLETHVYCPKPGHVLVVPLGQIQVSRAQRQPPLAGLGIEHLLGEQLGELMLLGYNIYPPRASSGGTVYLSLFWQAIACPEYRYRVALFLAGKRWARPLLPASVTALQAGDVFATQYSLVVSQDGSSREAPLLVTLETQSGERVAGPASLGMLAVRIDDRVFDLPTGIQNPRHVTLGDHLVFQGFDLSDAQVRPGGMLHLTLYWQAEGWMRKSYTVFTHLLDGQEQIWGQTDSIPADGDRPTTGWLPGEVLVDTYDISVRPDAPRGLYVIEVGLYDVVTGERLPVRDQEGNRLHGDRILLSPVEVLPPGAGP